MKRIALMFILWRNLASCDDVWWVGANTYANWTDTSGWSSGILPGPQDNVYVGYNTSNTLLLSFVGGNSTIKSLSLARTISQFTIGSCSCVNETKFIVTSTLNAIGA